MVSGGNESSYNGGSASRATDVLPVFLDTIADAGPYLADEYLSKREDLPSHHTDIWPNSAVERSTNLTDDSQKSTGAGHLLTDPSPKPETLEVRHEQRRSSSEDTSRLTSEPSSPSMRKFKKFFKIK
jgi:hypothetical protein